MEPVADEEGTDNNGDAVRIVGTRDRYFPRDRALTA
jgi:hypothetical protein